MPAREQPTRRGRPRELDGATKHEVTLDAPSRATVAQIEREQELRGMSAAIRWALAQVARGVRRGRR